MENKSIILFFVGFIVVFFFGMAVFNNIFDTALLMDTTTITTSDTILANNGTANTLSQTPETVSSTVVKNQTWLEFDGVDDFVNLSSSSNSFNITNYTDFSYNIWIKTGDAGAVGLSIIGDRNTDTQTNVGHNLILESIKKAIKWQISSGGTRISCQDNLALNDSKWHMVTVAVNRSNKVNIRVDGIGRKDCDVFTENGSLENGLDMVIGGEWHNVGLGIGWFNGSIDYPKFYTKRLVANDIIELYNQSDYGTGLGKAVIILNYHNVESGQANRSNTNITYFTEHINYSNYSGVSTITYTQLINWKNGLGTIPEKSIIINFDDVSNTVYTNAKPIMDNYSFIGVFSVNTKYVGTGGKNVSWEQLQNLTDDGWEIVSHGTTHTSSITMSVPELTSWFNDSRWAIRNNLSLSDFPKVFVYPWAISNGTVDNECLKYYDYCINKTAGFGTLKQYNHIKDINNLTIRRMTSIGNESTLTDFKPVMGIYADLVLDLKLNENQGTTAYDVSGNANNGTISGATWDNDGVDVSLVEDTDFTISGDTFTIINDLYSWTQITIDYNYVVISSSLTTTILRFVGGFIALAFIGLLLIPIMKQLNEVKTK